MASTMSDAELTALRAARASGVLTTEYQGRRVTWRSLAELDAIIAREEAARAAASGTRIGYTIARFVRA